MPAVFVHGNPETGAIWGPLFDALQRKDVIALSPPGFGAPVPDGWTATRREYIDWLGNELHEIEGPIDLVGHDWGGGHVAGLIMEQPELVRSWCVDVLGIFHNDYVWHDAAQVWQTPGAGEENIAAMVGAPKADMIELYTALGMTADVAAQVAEGVDTTMGECILALYRDAVTPLLSDTGLVLAAAASRPGLMLNAENDDYVGSDVMAQEVADLAGATVVKLAGVGHWWMCEAPDLAAATLESFWSSSAF